MAKKKCPSCGRELLDGKYCPDCGAELVDENTMEPSSRFMDELTERVATRTADIIEKRRQERVEKKQQASGNENTDANGKTGPGTADQSGGAKKKSFFGRE
jgi:uncharacterized Zn finger protein (UPF0148 family)